MTCVKYFQFSAAVQGFHYYRKSGLPEPEQTLNCFHEEGTSNYELANVIDTFDHLVRRDLK